MSPRLCCFRKNTTMKKTLAPVLLAAGLCAWVAAAAPEKDDIDPAERGGPAYITDKAPKTLKGGWVLDWNDEFNGSSLDMKKWKYELGVVRNPGSSQAYTKDCVKVQNGKLKIRSEARLTPNEAYSENATQWFRKLKDRPFASGSVTTRGVKHFKVPGRLEFRARIPKAKGVWPAIWTMHVNQYGWPANGEIDILEHISQEPNKVYTIFRWGKNGTNQEFKPVVRGTVIPDFSKKFHTYVLEWTHEYMRVLIDDKEVARTAMSAAQYPNGDNPLLSPCYLIINTAIGGPGTWPETPNASQYPVTFEVDYVRYYTKKDADTTTAKKSNKAKD